MRAFEIYLNDEKLCVAGIGEDGVLSATAVWVSKNDEGDVFLDVSGLISETEKHVRWVRQESLRDGDTIQIKVVQSQTVDPPLKD